MVDLRFIKYLSYANSCYETFKIVHIKNKSPIYLYPIKYFLLCRAIELGFKSVLIFNKVPESIYKYEIGHDLNESYNLVKIHSKIRLNKKQVEILEILNQYYRKKEFEYAMTSSKLLPTLDEMVPIYIKITTSLEGYKIKELTKRGSIKSNKHD